MYYSSFPYGYSSWQQAFIPAHPAYIAMPQQTGDPFPKVNTRKLNDSAQRFKQVMDQANRFLSTLMASDDFATKLMDAAQRSNKQEVERLVRSTGVTIKYSIQYTPSGIQIDFSNSDAQSRCCTLRMRLGW